MVPVSQATLDDERSFRLNWERRGWAGVGCWLRLIEPSVARPALAGGVMRGTGVLGLAWRATVAALVSFRAANSGCPCPSIRFGSSHG